MRRTAEADSNVEEDVEFQGEERAMATLGGTLIEA